MTHPRLCEENSEALMGDLLRPGAVCITPACGEKKQAKLPANGFVRAVVPIDDEHWIPVIMGLKNTDGSSRGSKPRWRGCKARRREDQGVHWE
jgi:hypothetical protein